MRQVSELTGAELDLWVARAEGKCYTVQPGVWGNALINDLGRLSIAKNSWDCAKYFEPSKNWKDGGPIIERELIELINDRDMREDGWFGCVWQARLVSGYFDGDHPLIAGMRCYVASKFGDTVDDVLQVQGGN